VKKTGLFIPLIAFAFGLLTASHAHAQITLLAIGNLDQSRAGSFADLSGLTYKLENGAPANLLGGLGSGIAYASGNTFLARPTAAPTRCRMTRRLMKRPASSGGSFMRGLIPTPAAQGCRLH
jgi:hypothetical protein